MYIIKNGTTTSKQVISRVLQCKESIGVHVPFGKAAGVQGGCRERVCHWNESQSQEQMCTLWTSIQYTLHGTRHFSTSDVPKMSLKQWYFSCCLGKWACILLIVNNQMTKQSTQKAKSVGYWFLCQMHVTGAQILPRSLCLFSWTNLFVVDKWLLYILLLIACGPVGQRCPQHSVQLLLWWQSLRWFPAVVLTTSPWHTNIESFSLDMLWESDWSLSHNWDIEAPVKQGLNTPHCL